MRKGHPRLGSFVPKQTAVPGVVSDKAQSKMGRAGGKPDPELEIKRQQTADVKQGEATIVTLGIPVARRRFPKSA